MTNIKIKRNNNHNKIYINDHKYGSTLKIQFNTSSTFHEYYVKVIQLDRNM
jgi:hypothetical protein